MTKKLVLAVGVAAAALLATGPAMAQKSKDTLRIAINDMFRVSDPYHFPLDENAQFYRIILTSLIEFNEYKDRFEPFPAKSWKRINKTTIEFTLRGGAKFHNGNEFTADDNAVSLLSGGSQAVACPSGLSIWYRFNVPRACADRPCGRSHLGRAA